MRLALVTDAWSPQVNGVVRTWQTVIGELNRLGHVIDVIHPALFRTLPCPTYPEIRLALTGPSAITDRIEASNAEAIHIATEGPLGLMARHYCVKRALPFTTSFHTKFPEYIEKRFFIPARFGYQFLRWFHRPAARMLVATPSLRRELEQRGFSNCHDWTRGVDTMLFHPDKRVDLGYARPLLLYVGRVAVEKNIEAFLALDHPGTKLIVGDGPERTTLETRYPQAVFVGAKHGDELAQLYASADVLVFPSKTDTFGLVMLEALASGTPVAAYPVTGPIDVITHEAIGRLNNGLNEAVKGALTLKREECRQFAESYSWERCAKLLLDALAPIQCGERPA